MAVPAPQSTEAGDNNKHNHDDSGTIEKEEEDTLIIGVEDKDLFLSEDTNEEKDRAKAQELQNRSKQRDFREFFRGFEEQGYVLKLKTFKANNLLDLSVSAQWAKNTETAFFTSTIMLSNDQTLLLL